jgi:hypothetical protein
MMNVIQLQSVAHLLFSGAQVVRSTALHGLDQASSIDLVQTGHIRHVRLRFFDKYLHLDVVLQSQWRGLQTVQVSFLARLCKALLERGSSASAKRVLLAGYNDYAGSCGVHACSNHTTTLPCPQPVLQSHSWTLSLLCASVCACNSEIYN